MKKIADYSELTAAVSAKDIYPDHCGQPIPLGYKVAGFRTPKSGEIYLGMNMMAMICDEQSNRVLTPRLILMRSVDMGSLDNKFLTHLSVKPSEIYPGGVSDTVWGSYKVVDFRPPFGGDLFIVPPEGFAMEAVDVQQYSKCSQIVYNALPPYRIVVEKIKK